MRNIFILWISIVQIGTVIEINASPCSDNGTERSDNPENVASGRDSDSDSISFPTDHPYIPLPCGKDSTVCEQIDNYPIARVDEELKSKAHKYEELFGSDVVVTDIANRNNGIDEESLCKSQERLIYPQAGLTKVNTWMYIVNQKNYTQGVRVEECIHTNQCDMTQSFPLGYETKCKQKFIYRQLLAIDENGHTVKDLFKLPSCCQCVLIRTDRNKRSIN